MLYDLLWLPKTATDEQIKLHYKQLAKAVHPDRNDQNEEQANLTFREVENAFRVLSNPVTRAIYDFYGDEGLGIYESYKQQFEEIKKEDKDARQKALSRYRVVLIIHKNNKALEQINMQKIDIDLNMMYYFMVNSRQWISPKPYARVNNVSYQAQIKYAKNASISIGIDGKNPGPLPSINHIFTRTLPFVSFPCDMTI